MYRTIDSQQSRIFALNNRQRLRYFQLLLDHEKYEQLIQETNDFAQKSELTTDFVTIGKKQDY